MVAKEKFTNEEPDSLGTMLCLRKHILNPIRAPRDVWPTLPGSVTCKGCPEDSLHSMEITLAGAILKMYHYFLSGNRNSAKHSPALLYRQDFPVFKNTLT
jgi:hypothetical protein